MINRLRRGDKRCDDGEKSVKLFSYQTHSERNALMPNESLDPDEPQLRIREMNIDDLSPVFHIGEEIFTAEFSPSLYRTWDEYEITTMFNSDSALCLVAERDEEIVGFALGTTVEKHNSAWKYGYLVWLGVRKGLQKGKVGDKLFREIQRRMREQGVRMIIVDTAADNEAAIRFFQKQGFGNVQEHVYMTLNLAKKRRRKKE